jgi:coenzyme F420-reducing hydrogenase delta subunit
MKTSFIPSILIFCCQNSVVSPKKLIEEFEHPERIKVVELPCTGKMETVYALKAFETGIDGVCVVGCMEGTCHYLEGNLRAKRRVHQIEVILDELKLESGRVTMLNVDSSDNGQFKASAGNFISRIQGLGQNPLKKSGSSSHR